MDAYVETTDRLRLHYERTGTGATGLVFVHGWLGDATWWNAQRDALAHRYTIVQLDLPGHGTSDKTRTVWSGSQFADDIRVVTDQLDARDLVLIGHSMSGAWVALAAPQIARTKAVILVDTLKDLGQTMPRAQIEQMLALYRSDFRGAVENVLPQYLYSKDTPSEVRERIQHQFLAADPALAIQIIEPLYRMDLQAAARRVTVPVRAINSDFTPTNVDANRRYFRDYDAVTIAAAGHYPMLERPVAFNRELARVLDELAP